MAYRSHSYAQAQANPLVVSTPSGTVDGDVMVAFAIIDSTTITPSPASGTWTALTDSPQTASHDGAKVAVWYKVASSEPGTHQFNTDSVGYAGGIITFSGRSGVPTVSSAASTGATSASSPWNVDATGITAVAGDDLLFIGHSDHNNVSPNTVAYTAPSGFTKAGAFGEPGSGGEAFFDALIAYKENVSAGATGTITGVGTLAGATAARIAFLIALPGSGGGGGGGNRRRRFLMAA